MAYGAHMDITTEATFAINPSELVHGCYDDIEAMIAEHVTDRLANSTDEIVEAARFEIEEAAAAAAEEWMNANDVPEAYDIAQLRSDIDALTRLVDQMRRDLDGLADTVDDGPDSEGLRWQTIGVLGMIDHALRNSPDPAPKPVPVTREAQGWNA